MCALSLSPGGPGLSRPARRAGASRDPENNTAPEHEPRSGSSAPPAAAPEDSQRCQWPLAVAPRVTVARARAKPTRSRHPPALAAL